MPRRLSPWSGRALAAAFVIALLAVGCSEKESVTESARSVLGNQSAPFATEDSEGVAFGLTPLPTSGVVVTGKAGAVCYSHDGNEQWRFEVSDGDEIIASPAVAPDSSTFLLTRRSLVSISISGERLWSTDVEPAELPAVVALGDGSAVVTSGNNMLVNYQTGLRKWHFRLPDNDTIASRPRVAGNSNVFVQGASRLYVIDPSGVPVWDTAL